MSFFGNKSINYKELYEEVLKLNQNSTELLKNMQIKYDDSVEKYQKLLKEYEDYKQMYDGFSFTAWTLQRNLIIKENLELSEKNKTNIKIIGDNDGNINILKENYIKKENELNNLIIKYENEIILRKKIESLNHDLQYDINDIKKK